MSVRSSDYEQLLAEYSDRCGAIALLRQYRPYLELLPSLRRPAQSIISMPLPVAKIRRVSPTLERPSEVVRLSCDLVLLTCDPEWKVKMGIEIVILIHRPDEEFSQLLGRWRQTQVCLGSDYEWIMPPAHRHVLSEGAGQVYPLFVIFDRSSDRIGRGLVGAGLPVVTRMTEATEDVEAPEAFFSES